MSPVPSSLRGEASRADRRHIVLVGHMGAGKTTLGQLLSARLDLPLSDSDTALLAGEGATARRLQERSGQSALHSLEATHLLQALGESRPHVICAAASTIDDDRCMAALASGAARVIWVRADPATLDSRHRGGAHRPAAVPEVVRRGREARLASLRPLIIGTDGAAPADVLEAALAAISR